MPISVAAQLATTASSEDDSWLQAAFHTQEEMAFSEGDRIFRYDSLNEHLVKLSLTRAIQRGESWHAARLAFGWLLNHACFTCLVLVFLVYGCVLTGAPQKTQGAAGWPSQAGCCCVTRLGQWRPFCACSHLRLLPH